ncbi:MAG: hypothetical protein LBK41_01845 [Clostridiales bacterium]|jgi:hypothetical protein|nr:hypothetical protein [Clostridiales bacterium]
MGSGKKSGRLGGLIWGLLIIVVIAAYLVMYFTAMPIMGYATNVMAGKVPAAETAGAPINAYNPLAKSDAVGQSRVSALQLCAFHNFTDGAVWALYTQEVYDQSGGEIIKTENKIAKWTIHKAGDEWEITDIE